MRPLLFFNGSTNGQLLVELHSLPLDRLLVVIHASVSVAPMLFRSSTDRSIPQRPHPLGFGSARNNSNLSISLDGALGPSHSISINVRQRSIGTVVGEKTRVANSTGENRNSAGFSQELSGGAVRESARSRCASVEFAIIGK